jgi:hypothetical protein
MSFESIFASARVVDLILVFMLVEASALILLWRIRGRGLKPADLIATLAAGACLLLALRSALAGATGMMVAFLLLSLVAHLADLARRWR